VDVSSDLVNNAAPTSEESEVQSDSPYNNEDRISLNQIDISA